VQVLPTKIDMFYSRAKADIGIPYCQFHILGAFRAGADFQFQPQYCQWKRLGKATLNVLSISHALWAWREDREGMVSLTKPTTVRRRSMPHRQKFTFTPPRRRRRTHPSTAKQHPMTVQIHPVQTHPRQRTSLDNDNDYRSSVTAGTLLTTELAQPPAERRGKLPTNIIHHDRPI